MKAVLILNIISFTSAILAYLSVVPYIGIYYNLFFIALYIFATLNEGYLHIKFPRILLNLLTIILIVMFSYHINMDSINAIILRCLILLLFIKLITPKRSRDYLQIIALTFFLIAGAALVSMNITYIILAVIVIVLSILQLLILSFYNFDQNYSFKNHVFIAIVKNIFTFAALLIPLTIILFVIIPRSNYPFFDILNKQDKVLSGFVDTIRLGESSSIYVDDRVAFRAKMPAINKKHLFWRGVELNTFDGNKWTYYNFHGNNRAFLNNERMVKQDIYLQPMGTKYIISLDKPVKISNENKDIFIKNYILSLNKKVNKPIYYTVYSTPSEVIYQPHINEKGYTKLPAINKKIVELAKQLKGKSNIETVENTLDYFKGNGFTYTVEDLPVSEEPLYEFLFESKKGNCELFASAFAVILRLNGISVRLISGFYGGEYNNYLKYYTVPFKNSHIWNEVWLNNKWFRVNPSPLVSTTSEQEGHLKSIRMFIDSIQYYWTIYVINYDLEKQLQVFDNLKKPFINVSLDNTLKHLILLFIIAIFLLIIVMVYRSLKNINRKNTEKLVKLFEKIINSKYGIKRNNLCIYTFINTLPLTLIKKDELTKLMSEIMSRFYKDIDLTYDEFNKLKKELKGVFKVLCQDISTYNYYHNLNAFSSLPSKNIDS